MKTNYTYKDAQEVQDNLNVNGFEVKVSADGEYFRLEIAGNPIVADSANADLYDIESATAAFNDRLESISEPTRWAGIVRAAIERGFTFKTREDLDNVFVNAEKFIIDNTPFEERSYDIVTDFWQNFHGPQQSLEWYDEDGECCVSSWGQIIGDSFKDRTYYRLKDGKLTKAEWFENEDEDVFTYLDTVVTTKGEVVTLIA